MVGTDNKCIVFLLGIFICFLLCVSPVCANGDLVNSTGLGYVADNSAYPDIDLNHDHILSEGSSDVSNGDDDKSNINSSNEKLEKSPIKNENNVKFEVVDSVEVGNFSSLNRELNDFIDNKDYKIVDYGTKDVRKVIDVEKSGKVQTFYLIGIMFMMMLQIGSLFMVLSLKNLRIMCLRILSSMVMVISLMAVVLPAFLKFKGLILRFAI